MKKSKKVQAAQMALPQPGDSAHHGRVPNEAFPEPVVNVQTLAQLVEAMPPVICEFSVAGQSVMVQGRRLRPAETRRLSTILEDAFPPELPGEKQADGTVGQPRYDVRDPEYRKRRRENQTLARALALWWGYPNLFQAAEGGPAEAGTPSLTEAQIVERIENGPLAEDVLELLYATVTQVVARPEEVSLRANFT